MNCRRVVSLMSAYVDGELTGVEMLEIRRHLDNCAECAEEHESTLAMKLAVSRLRTIRPREDFVNSMLATLDVVQVPRYQRIINSSVRIFRSKLSPVAAALAVSSVALVLMSAGGMDNVGQQDQSQMVASAPYDGQAIEVKYVPKIPGSPISLSPSSRPLVVNESGREFTPKLELVSMAGR